MLWKQMISQLPYFVLIRLVILREAGKEQYWTRKDCYSRSLDICSI